MTYENQSLAAFPLCHVKLHRFVLAPKIRLQSRMHAFYMTPFRTIHLLKVCRRQEGTNTRRGYRPSLLCVGASLLHTHKSGQAPDLLENKSQSKVHRKCVHDSSVTDCDRQMGQHDRCMTDAWQMRDRQPLRMTDAWQTHDRCMTDHLASMTDAWQMHDRPWQTFCKTNQNEHMHLFVIPHGSHDMGHVAQWIPVIHLLLASQQRLLEFFQAQGPDVSR